MGTYRDTVTFEDVEGVVYEVVTTGYCGNDGGQSDVEGPTLYLIDGVEVELSELTADELVLLQDMENNRDADERFNLKTEWV